MARFWIQRNCAREYGFRRCVCTYRVGGDGRHVAVAASAVCPLAIFSSDMAHASQETRMHSTASESARVRPNRKGN